MKAAKASQMAAKMVEADEPLRLLAGELDKVVHEVSDIPWDQLRTELEQVHAALDDLPAFLQCLAEIDALPPVLAAALCTLPLKPAQIEAAVVAQPGRCLPPGAAVCQLHRQRPRSPRLCLERLYGQWLSSNAGEVRQRVRQRFLENVPPCGPACRPAQ